jgi:flagellar biosynthetic protein FliQ
MTPDQVAEILRQLLREAMIVAAPILVAAALLSFLLSLLQTLTSLQEQSLTAVPRLFAVVAILAVGMPWFLHRLATYTVLLYTNFGRYTRFRDALRFWASQEARRTGNVDGSATDWNSMAARFALALVRVSAMLALAPFFSPRPRSPTDEGCLCAGSLRSAGSAVAAVAAKRARLENAPIRISFTGLLGEVAVGALYGLTLSLFNEMLLLAGQIVGSAVQLFAGQPARSRHPRFRPR